MNKRFFNWLDSRLAEYAENREAALKAHATRWANVQAKRNNGDLPTMSERDGEVRMHAPYDGYIHVWVKGDMEYEKAYLGGQYLPYDNPESNGGYYGSVSTGETTIFDVPADRADKFEAEWKEHGIDGKVISIRVSGRSYTKSYHDGPLKVVTISHCPDDIRAAIDNYIMGDIYKLRQLEADKVQSERDARDKAHREGEEVESGRQEITGVVLSLKEKYTDWGCVLKMLVQDDRGFRVWGTVPDSLGCVRGDRVKFVGTVQQSDNDTRFGFFKRPAKAVNLSEQEEAA